MTISRKLLLIVLLTIVEISITIWGTFQIAKGAKFHQLNFLHVKYNEVFSDQIDELYSNTDIDLEAITSTIKLIRQQPYECLERANQLDKIIMKMIGTYQALELCHKDIEDADNALNAILLYKQKQTSRTELVSSLQLSVNEFFENSNKFEAPVTQTVEFTIGVCIPLILVISGFNIGFIVYLSRNITGSIQNSIQMLSKADNYEALNEQIDTNIRGELRELLLIAKQRIEIDLFNAEKNKKLQSLLDEKTASLLAANQELEQFSYRTSHDIKSPLTRSKRLCQFALQDYLAGQTDGLPKHLQLVIEQMEGLETLVENLLSLAKADLVESQSEMVQVSAVLKEVVHRISDLIDENKVDVRLKLDSSKSLYCDKVRLSQVLENLLSNACKYSDKNKVQAWLCVSTNANDGEYIIEIEDNGLGIPPQHRDELFAKFKRFHPRVCSGTGLGMSIVKRHVEKMMGTIDYEATHTGSKFVISLPNPKQDDLEKNE